jgi:hypothetical protein
LCTARNGAVVPHSPRDAATKCCCSIVKERLRREVRRAG